MTCPAQQSTVTLVSPETGDSKAYGEQQLLHCIPLQLADSRALHDGPAVDSCQT